MFDFSELKTLHIELTSRCQASCPMCARNYHGGQKNTNLPLDEISLEDFKKIVDAEVFDQIGYIYFCGNYGDPIMSTDLIDIIEYCKTMKPSINIGIHTNGSARTKDWWQKLAEALPEEHCVHFAIDGLADTHHLYRIGTDFDKIIENAKTFISNGGKAEWVYLSFKHNEHQINEAKELARTLGFEKFNHKATSRFLEKPWLDVLDQDGNVAYKIEPPQEHKITFIDPKIILGYKKVVETAEIRCKVMQDKSLYIDAFKNLWPCCWIGALPYIYSKSTDLIHTYQTEQTAVINELVESIGGYTAIDLKSRSIKEILSDSQWRNIWSKYWEDKKLATCAKTCGVFPEKILTQYDDQFVKVETFNE
jgi:MoaA/NifB/PqqE/SkfB family radical SAM enzyme